MESRRWIRLLPGAVAALLCGLCVAIRAAAAEDVALPVWQVLVFEQRAFGVTARSRLQIDRHPEREDGALQLDVGSAVSNNTESVALTLEPHSLGLLRRTRLSRGRDQRYKTYDYLPEYVLRERREPAGKAAGDPEQWAASSRREVDYPANRDDLAVTDAYALLLLAGRFQAGSAEAVEVAVHTDFNFYRVRMTRGAAREIPVDYRVAGEDRRVKGGRRARVVELEVSPLATLQDKPDFSLLGLERDIRLLYDDRSDLLLQLQGAAPRIGNTTLQLREVTLREPET